MAFLALFNKSRQGGKSVFREVVFHVYIVLYTVVYIGEVAVSQRANWLVAVGLMLYRWLYGREHVGGHLRRYAKILMQISIGVEVHIKSYIGVCIGIIMVTIRALIGDMGIKVGLEVVAGARQMVVDIETIRKRIWCVYLMLWQQQRLFIIMSGAVLAIKLMG